MEQSASQAVSTWRKPWLWIADPQRLVVYIHGLTRGLGRRSDGCPTGTEGIGREGDVDMGCGDTADTESDKWIMGKKKRESRKADGRLD
jgi:hypothetical protein